MGSDDCAGLEKCLRRNNNLLMLVRVYGWAIGAGAEAFGMLAMKFLTRQVPLVEGSQIGLGRYSPSSFLKLIQRHKPSSAEDIGAIKKGREDR